jgi:DeoR/GlpR family transcriptional regulator of sugar metabolism
VKRRQRLRHLIELLRTREELSVQQACDATGASAATIRRAFAELAESGDAEKTWGGIRPKAGITAITPPAFAARLSRNAGEKRAIGRAAAALIREGDVVMIDGGTTTFQMAEFIAGRRIRIITNSLVIAQAVDQWQGARRGAEVLLCGGTLQPESGIVAGPAAESFLKRYRADWLFLGCAGVDERQVTNYEEAVLGSERLMIERSARLVLLADASKLGRAAMCQLCPTRQLDWLVTSAPARHPMPRKIMRLGVKIEAVAAVESIR